jgi:DNA-binding GntR family transcriptional regulator
MRDLAERYGVARNTVGSALRVLRDERLVVARQGSGAFVRSEVPAVDPEPGSGQLEAITGQVAELARRVELLGQRMAELEAMVHPRG